MILDRSDETLARLTQYTKSFHVDMLNERDFNAVRNLLIDAAACAVSAFDEAAVVRMCALASRYTGPQMARIWNCGTPSSVEMAAFANGTALRYLDLSDTYMSRNAGHPSDMVAGLITLAESMAVDGKALIAAVVVAYELYGGLCDAVALREHAIDQALCAAVGAAAGAARLLSLNDEQIAQAISIALSANVHLYNVRRGVLSEWKGLAGPNGVRNGIFAALLAKEGVVGPKAPIEGAGGLFEMVGPFYWSVGESDQPRVVDTHIKLYAVCYHGQCAMNAVLALRPQVVLPNIEKILLETYDAAYSMMGEGIERWKPGNRETADHSLPYVVAVGLIEGCLNADAYNSDQLGRPDIAALMQKVHVRKSAEFTAKFPQQLPVRVSIFTRNGEVFVHEQNLPRGHARNPATNREIEEKFLKAFEAWRGPAHAQRALEIFSMIDRLPHSGALVDMLCAPTSETSFSLV